MYLHSGLGTILDGLKDHAIPVGEFEQLIELVLRGVGVNVEPQADLLEADRYALCSLFHPQAGADRSRQIVVLKGRQLIEIIARSKLKSLPIGGSVWITLADLDLLAHLHRSDRMNFPQREALGLAPY